MKGWVLALAALAVFWGAEAQAHKEKRTDACGCHHEWGLRHCHPKEKTPRCEAPVVRSEKPAPEKAPAPPPVHPRI